MWHPTSFAEALWPLYFWPFGQILAVKFDCLSSSLAATSLKGALTWDWGPACSRMLGTYTPSCSSLLPHTALCLRRHSSLGVSTSASAQQPSGGTSWRPQRTPFPDASHPTSWPAAPSAYGQHTSSRRRTGTAPDEPVLQPALCSATTWFSEAYKCSIALSSPSETTGGRSQAICWAEALCSAGRLAASLIADPDAGNLELTEENVELVLDEVRPYLMAGAGTAQCICHMMLICCSSRQTVRHPADQTHFCVCFRWRQRRACGH